jgi:NAD(P)-dependent dehydrogenase (short-subunit alcohol dehydrogenase family)
MAGELRDKVVAITGGTKGIGLRVALAFLREGAQAFICGRGEAALRSALEVLGASGPDRAAGIAADVRVHDDCRRFIESAAARFGGLDILVNNAGIGIYQKVEDLTPEEWRATIETNLSGAFYCSREAIPLLRRRGGGFIFNISSLAGKNAFPEGAAYNASKFGLNGFSEALMQEVRHDGIRVSTILPGSVATGFRPAGKDADEGWKLTGDDVARAIIDLCRFPSHALASWIELRPSRPPQKGS